MRRVLARDLRRSVISVHLAKLWTFVLELDCRFVTWTFSIRLDASVAERSCLVTLQPQLDLL